MRSLIYELNTRCWLAGLSRLAGAPVSLANVPATEIAAWRRLGVTHVWLMGIWQTGQHARARALSSLPLRESLHCISPPWTAADLDASPYAIANYVVTESLGGADGLALFRQTLHKNGMRLLLDFVPNHVGLDHRWIHERPSFFVQATPGPSGFCSGSACIAHGRDPFFPPWTDTAQLDYRSPQVHRAMSDLLLEIARLCDGVRCDMAMLCLTDVFERTWKDFPVSGPTESREFWEHAIARVKAAYPEFIFLAEAYWGLEQQLIQLGFDFAYDKELLDHLVARDFTALQRHVRQVLRPGQSWRVHFLENHDEERAAARFSPAEYRAFALLNFSLPGMGFLHQGQLTGSRLKIPVQLRRCNPEPVDRAIQTFYTDLLQLLPRTALGVGECSSPPVHGSDPSQSLVILAWKQRPAVTDFVVTNLGSAPVSAWFPTLSTPPEDLSTPLRQSLRPLFRVGEFNAELCPARHGNIRVSLGPHAGGLLRAKSAV